MLGRLRIRTNSAWQAYMERVVSCHDRLVCAVVRLRFWPAPGVANEEILLCTGCRGRKIPMSAREVVPRMLNLDAATR
jgi:hypothetical protein